MAVTQSVRSEEAANLALATRVRWTNVAPTLLVVWIVSMFDKSNISLVIANPRFLSEMGLAGHAALLGWLASGLFLAYGLFAPVWGWITARIGPRKAVSAALVIWALTCFMSAVSSSYGMLLLSRILLGVGEAALYPITVSLVANWFPLRERGRATSFWWIGTMIGPMLTGLVITGLIITVGWRMQFNAMGILALILPLPMVWFLITDRPDQHRSANAAEVRLIESGALERNEDAPGRVFQSVRSVWSNHRFWLVTAAIAANAIFFWGWSIWLPTYLRTARHFSFSTSGYLTFVIYGFAVATIIAIGAFSDRVFRRAPLAGVGWLLGAVSLMAAAFVPNAIWAVVLMILALCFQQVGISCAEMLMHSVVGTPDMPKANGVRSFVTQMVGALSPAMIGYILQLTGGFVGAFMVLAAAVVVSAGCMVAVALEGL
jgi:sugar phosphate permease